MYFNEIIQTTKYTNGFFDIFLKLFLLSTFFFCMLHVSSLSVVIIWKYKIIFK